MSGLADIMALMVSLMDAPEAEAFAGRTPLERADDAGILVQYFQHDTEFGIVSVTVGAEEGRVNFLSIVGEESPVDLIGQPTVRWIDAEASTRAWLADQARREDAVISPNGREIFILDRPDAPLRISAGPDFPAGPWTDQTRGLHVLSYRVELATVTERTAP